MLEVKNLSVAYGNIKALKGVSLTVNDGEIVTLIGSNGAGKTTLLRTISGLLRPESGEISFLNQRIDGLPPNRIVRLGISQVPEGRRVFASLSVLDNLYLGAYLRRSRSEVEESFDQVFQLFPRLKERLNQRAGTLSGGEQQMLAVARALMSCPMMLLLDEPSLGLAPNLVDAVFDAILKIRRQGVTVLLVEQNAFMALTSADRAYVIETGEISMHGDAKSLLWDDKVRQAYLGEVVADS